VRRHRSRPLAAPTPRAARPGRLQAAIGLPQTIVVDNGPEFAGRTLDVWAYARGVTLRFIRPGKPIENAYVESFNGKFRDECLNEHWFVNLVDAKATIEAWRIDYNTVRPHKLAGWSHARSICRDRCGGSPAIADSP
jgi:transposase InsO family protein